jgi:hypothetical protein
MANFGLKEQLDLHDTILIIDNPANSVSLDAGAIS